MVGAPVVSTRVGSMRVMARVWPVHMAARVGPVQVVAPRYAATERAGRLRERHGAGRDRVLGRARAKARRLFAVRSHEKIVVIGECFRNRREARVHS